MRTMTFLKFTSFPELSVSLPSSKSWRNMLYTSWSAFSISSRRSTQCCLFFTASVNCPPFSYPTYPGFEPINLVTEFFSEYSDISNLIRAFSSPKISSASFFAMRLFPVPDLPIMRIFAMVFDLSPSPTLLRLITLHMLSTASSCPMTDCFSTVSIVAIFCFSSDERRATGIPVMSDTV